MNRWICNCCGTVFDEPRKRVTTEWIDGHLRTDTELICPLCGEPYIDPVVPCPGCDGFKFPEEILCKDCRKDLLQLITSFADDLTAEQEQQFNDWMDGDIIENRRKWG